MGYALRSLAMVVGLGMCLVCSVAAAQSATLRWYGHAFFLLTSAQGVRVAMDPYGAIGYPMPRVEAGVVTVSHEHGDHNDPNRLAGAPEVLRGLKAGGVGWNPVSYQKKDVRITAIPAYHDDVQGQKRGLNTIFIVETGHLRLAHLSDIGHTLSEAIVKAMGRIDILLVPVGGNFSIDGRQAKEIMSRLRPRISIPIHYKTPVTASWPIEDESAFLAGLKNVRRLDTLTVSLTPETLPAQPEVWVMRYR
ncbi:MAG: MBL fold metallo-hydrolase [SAR324 cluster bacterium]|nr:MBL fold metallo-hydrolase [SAR324 cluster bacterium]